MDEESQIREWPKLSFSENQKLALACLDSTVVGTIATHNSPRGPWAATVFFTFDENFGIFFVSQRNTRHMQDILVDNNVAFSAFTPISKSKGSHIQVQINGLAVPVQESEVEKAYTARERRLTGAGTWLPGIEDIFKVYQTGAVFMVIRPQEVWYVNSALFGGDRKLIPVKF
ncbi:MAG: pyridoxamine 5'-phosphate oxidase family protein [Candidatus Micrarchaeota archaeon]|nr:pyridoxamine 5'-phosphate oxidase family protein [Candidatus Micrarchaeota archaeon]MDE1846569.1 pyridoxamine 5'-phosphate oxidase family protein [Candidatus Micrarchaeota archaeon]